MVHSPVDQNPVLFIATRGGEIGDKRLKWGTFLVAQRLGLCDSTAGGVGLISSQETKIL